MFTVTLLKIVIKTPITGNTGKAKVAVVNNLKSNFSVLLYKSGKYVSVNTWISYI